MENIPSSSEFLMPWMDYLSSTAPEIIDEAGYTQESTPNSRLEIANTVRYESLKLIIYNRFHCAYG